MTRRQTVGSVLWGHLSFDNVGLSPWVRIDPISGSRLRGLFDRSLVLIAGGIPWCRRPTVANPWAGDGPAVAPP